MQLKGLLEFFQKMGWIISFGVTIRQISGVEYKNKKTNKQTKKNPKKKANKKHKNPAFSRVDMLIVVVQNPKIHSIF